MTSLGAEEDLVEFLSGIDAEGKAAARSFQTWTGATDSTGSAIYSSLSGVRKWGEASAGTGATVTYAFDPASSWSPSEQSAFVSAMHLWQAEANIQFTPSPSASDAEIMITRDHDGKAEGYIEGSSVVVGSAALGTTTAGGVEIDTSVSGFGPVGSAFSDYGGYVWMTVLHEIGHSIGLGHSGPYDGTATQMNTAFDNRAMSIMSYFDPSDAGWSYDWGDNAGYSGMPVTPMPLDILAAQRLYGLPVGSPLAGGDVFGFNSNIQGDIARYFDFTINSRPIVTLWSGGTGNTLDLSGFLTDSQVSLRAGYDHSSSVGGLTHNLTIADGTRIDTLMLGSGNDSAGGNDDGDVIIGGGGADTLSGGASNDHLFGGGTAPTAGDVADYISGGAGGDYIQGNAGADTLAGGPGSDRIYGGADDDNISGDTGNDSINGNRGNDLIDAGDGNDLVRGGQGDDTIQGGFGADTLYGDMGNDHISGGPGLDTLIGGDGADEFDMIGRDAVFQTQGAEAYLLDLIADYQDGMDHLHFDQSVGTILQLGAMANVQDAVAAATAATATIANSGIVAVAAIGGDTVVFFWESGVGMEGFRIAALTPDHVTTADFV